MPRACRAARCWSRRWSAPTAGSMRWRRARSRSAASRRGRGGQRHARRADGRAASPTAPSSNAKWASRSQRRRSLRLSLHNPDLTTATRIAAAINAYLGNPWRRSTDPATVHCGAGRLSRRRRGSSDRRRAAEGRSRRARASVVIDEQSGVIVMGSDVRISTVAIAQGNLTIKRHRDAAGRASPGPFSNGTTQVCRARTSRSTTARATRWPC